MSTYSFTGPYVLGQAGGKVTLVGCYSASSPLSADLFRASSLVATASLGVTQTETTATFVLSSAPLAEDYTVRWTVGNDTPTNECVVAKSLLYPGVSDSDLFLRAGGLNPSAATRITDVSDFAPYIAEAWTMLTNRLHAMGRRPWLILSPSALREPHITLSLSLIFADLEARSPGAPYGEIAARYREESERAFNGLQLVYADKKQATTSTLWVF